MRKGRNKISADFNMSSMTDIVFLLLIFFMLTSTLVTVNAIDVLLPKASGKTENRGVLSVSVTKDGVYYIDKDVVAPENLENSLLARLGEDRDKTVVLRGDGFTDYNNVVRVLDIGNRNKLKLILATDGK